MNTQQAYINGFIKRANEYGLNQYQAVELLKQANPGDILGGAGEVLQGAGTMAKGVAAKSVPASQVVGLGSAFNEYGKGNPVLGTLNAATAIAPSVTTNRKLKGAATLLNYAAPFMSHYKEYFFPPEADFTRQPNTSVKSNNALLRDQHGNPEAQERLPGHVYFNAKGGNPTVSDVNAAQKLYPQGAIPDVTNAREGFRNIINPNKIVDLNNKLLRTGTLHADGPNHGIGALELDGKIYPIPTRP